MVDASNINEMKKDMLVDDIEAANEAVKSSKLRQIASGFIYDEDKQAHYIDTARCDAAIDWWLDINKRPAIIFYEFVEQYEHLKLFFHKYMAEDLDAFKKGAAPVLLAQVSSLSHGVDGLQDVCHDALFYHPVWSRDATEQAIGRIWRTGQQHEVDVTTLVCNDTLDDVVVARVEGRAEWMELFKKHLGK